VLTALVGLPLLVFIIGWSRPWQFSAFVMLLTIRGLWEYFSMAFPRERAPRVAGLAAGVVISMALLFPDFTEPGLWIAVALIAVFALFLFFPGEIEDQYRSFGSSLIGIFYAGYLLPYMALLFSLPQGRAWVFFVIGVVMAGDTAAYGIGSRLGRRRLAPRLSPNKTVEGAVGSFAIGLVAAGLANWAFALSLPWPELLLLAAAVNVLAQLGDLFESWIKRAFSVKDAGALLPGHGGLLDRMDSLIFPFVAVTYYVKLVRL
jgi:phosphatidate cytidylyltransferase